MKNLKKVMPLTALCLGLAVFLGNAATKPSGKSTNQEWMTTDPDAPANPENYTEAPAGTQNDCEGLERVCVVIAPEDANNKPDFASVPGLETALEGDLDHPNIIKAPYTP